MPRRILRAVENGLKGPGGGLGGQKKFFDASEDFLGREKWLERPWRVPAVVKNDF
jgi:hypothetical protein